MSGTQPQNTSLTEQAVCRLIRGAMLYPSTADMLHFRQRKTATACALYRPECLGINTLLDLVCPRNRCRCQGNLGQSGKISDSSLTFDHNEPVCLWTSGHTKIRQEVRLYSTQNRISDRSDEECGNSCFLIQDGFSLRTALPMAKGCNTAYSFHDPDCPLS